MDLIGTLVGTHIAIPWNCCQPYHYGEYKGRLKNGSDCKIDVDWKVKVYNTEGEQVGTDLISFWLCDIANVKSLIEELEDR
jgi:hypothetical protein